MQPNGFTTSYFILDFGVQRIGKDQLGLADSSLILPLLFLLLA
jgi:hypothetical protein